MSWTGRWLAMLAAIGVGVLAFQLTAFYALNLAFGYPPDEHAHLSYVRDVVASGGLLPDYDAGKILDGRGNYLNHPFLYYAAMGAVARIAGLDPVLDFYDLRLLNAALVSFSLVLFFCSARRVGLSVGVSLIVSLACIAIPMFSVVAASINNDNFVYFGFSLFFLGVIGLFLAEDWRRRDVVLVALGGGVVFLTKATASIFVAVVMISLLIFCWRNIFKSRISGFVLKVVSALIILCAAYYFYVLIRYGSLFPKPSDLYAAGYGVMEFPGFAIFFLQTMLERFPVVMAHETISYLGWAERLALQIFVFSPTVFYVLLRVGGCVEPSRRRLLADVFVFALIVFFICHLVACFFVYKETGLTAGIQPRYYLYLFPAIWIVCIAAMREITFVFIVSFFFGAATIAYGGVMLNASGVVDASKGSAVIFNEINFLNEPSLDGVGYATGSFDELRYLSDGVLVKGWAASPVRSDAIVRVVFFYKNKYVGSGPVDGFRPDVARALGKSWLRKSGFNVLIRIDKAMDFCDIDILFEARSGLNYKIHNNGALCDK